MRGLVVVALLAVACGSGKESEPTSGPTEPTGEPAAQKGSSVELAIATDGSVTAFGVAVKSEDDLQRALHAVRTELGEAGCAIRVAPGVRHRTTQHWIDQCVVGGVTSIAVDGVPLEVPRAAAGGISDDPLAVVSIAKDGSVYVLDTLVEDAHIEGRIREIIDAGTEVVVIADDDVPTTRVVDVWKRAIAAGVPSIRRVVVAEPRDLPMPLEPSP